MNLEHYRKLLLAKQDELLTEMARIESEAGQISETEVHDEMDRVIDSEAKAALLSRNSLEYSTLQQVRAALRRIDDGTYGFCQTCGRPIDEKRLEAVPWAEFDLEHQEILDRRT